MKKDDIEFLLKSKGLKYEKEYKFLEDRKFRFDFYLTDYKAGIEYEGIVSQRSRHTSVTGFSKDCEKYNLAQLNGFKVLRYTALNLKQLTTDLDNIMSI